MKNLFRKTIAMLVAFAMLLSFLPAEPAAAADGEQPTIPDGVYPIQYRYVKDKSTVTSAANVYMLPDTGRLVIADGQATFEHEVTKEYFATFAYLGSRLPGEEKAVISGDVVTGMDGYLPVSVREADNPDNVVVSVFIEDIWIKQDVLMHIWDKENIFGLPMLYNYWYNAQLELYLDDIDLTPPEEEEEEEEEEDNYENLVVTAQLFEERATVGRDVYGRAVEGEGHGFYPIGSRAVLYDSIVSAETLADQAGGNAALLKAAYIILDQAIKKFEASRIVVAKSRLTDLIARASAWADTAKDAGTAETGVISEGEYPADASIGTVSSFRYRIGRATTVAEDVYAAQSEVDKEYNWLYYGQTALTDTRSYGFRDVTKRQFVASNVDVIVLDSLDRDAKISLHAGDMEPTALLLQQAEDPYYIAYANFTFNDPNNELVANSVRRPTATSLGTFTSSIGSTAKLVTGLSTDTHKVYQANVRVDGVDDATWQGLWAFQYPASLPAAERKTVYISFNASQLAELNALIDEARALHDNAVVGTEPGRHAAGQIAKLQAAIDEAEATGSWLAAPRPQIVEATAKLQAAVDEFAAAAAHPVYFSAAHATSAAFSTMENYFAKPAVIMTEDNGSKHAVMTITDSASVPEFKVKQPNGEFVPVATVSENTAANTRVVKFPIAGLSALLDAQVRTVVPAQQYDRTHDIRLNFNDVDNTALYQAIQAAQSALRAAVEGTEPGQYPPGAKAALQAAVDAAGAEAVRVEGTAADTAAALLSLEQALAVFQASAISGPGGPGGPLADGEYTLDFMIYKKGTREASVMYDYVDPNSGKLIVSGGKKHVSFTLKQHAEILSFKTMVEGVLTETETVSVDTANNTRVVRFEVDDLTAILGGWVKIYWELPPPIGVYDHEYDVDIGFSNIEDGEGGNGEEEEPGHVPGNPGNGNGGNGNPNAPNLSHNGFADGTYSIDFTILKKGTSQSSVMMDYVETPGILKVRQGKQYVSLTLRQSKEVTDFQVEVNGSLRSPSVISEDTENNTRDVQFEVADLTEKLDAWVKIVWPEMNYFHDYDIDLVFDVGSVSPYTPSPSSGSPRPTGPKAPAAPEEEAPAEEAEDETGGAPAAPDVKLSDVKGHWAETMIERAVRLGIVNGYGDGTFRPDATVSRGEFAVMISRALKLERKTAPIEFADAGGIPGWAKPHVDLVTGAGLIAGYADRTFRAERMISRAEIAVIVSRALGLAATADNAPAFADAEQIPEWARAHVAAAAEAVIILGRTDNRFAPNENATRAEALTLILRILDYNGRTD